ncbi:unnamed protein product [Bursaphelenchus okinawaensis]|uniref:glucuronosyltransferase n=1 Tax=Bursaphelenchus okinawaensis TaxID=465554 RepID=A0A811K532_9BILA|nr:unnamed protein product [Bursaphelenchus okinawaensis]CAG9091522.1 unnamed protein product [Bursaphelenchus okinawaensis]
MKGLLVFLLLWVTCSDAFKILLYSPNYSRSHINFIGKLADLYIDAGHEAVVFRPELLDDDPNILINGTKARVIWFKKRFESGYSAGTLQSDAWTMGNDGIIKTLTSGWKVMQKLGATNTKMCDQILDDDQLVHDLKAENFDIGLIQIFDVCGAGLFKKIGLEKFVLASSMPLSTSISAAFGLPYSLSYVPDFLPTVRDYGSFVKRVSNILGFAFTKGVLMAAFQGYQVVSVQKHFPEFTADRALGNASLLFVNSDEHVEYPRPISHKVVYIGGFALSDPKPLKNPYKEVLDEAKNGAILISFGSIAQSVKMPNATKQAFVDTFKAFPDIKFIWKYEQPDDDVANGLDNVIKSKWVPQTDILDHKNVVAFVTHGGMNSVSEASHFGVPMYCIFLFGDQFRNCKMVQEKGLGLVGKKGELTKDVVFEALKELINNKSYYQKARAIAEMIKGKPMQPAERVLKYTQYAATYDVKQVLELEGRHQNVIEFYNIDVYLVFLTILWLVPYVFYKLVRCCCCRRKAVKSKRE